MVSMLKPRQNNVASPAAFPSSQQTLIDIFPGLHTPATPAKTSMDLRNVESTVQNWDVSIATTQSFCPLKWMCCRSYNEAHADQTTFIGIRQRRSKSR